MTAIIGLLVFFSQNTDDTPLDINILQSVFIVLLVLLILVLAENILGNHKRSRVREQCIAQSFHILAHRFRDEIFQTLRDYENKELSQPLLIKHLMDFLDRSLIALCNIMSDFTGEEICACIQMIRYSNDEQINNAEVYVLCRSENSDERRKNQDNDPKRHLLTEDPILLQMVGPDALPFFSCSNLKKYRKSHANDKAFIENFRNSLISSYKGVFIVPIRIANSVRRSSETDSPFHVVGFLCLDTKSTKVFLSEHENNYAKIAKTFADIFMLHLKYMTISKIGIEAF